MIQTVFKSWFIDFEKSNEFIVTEQGAIPRNWKNGFFDNIVVDTLGGDWGKETPCGNYIKEVYCIRGADIPEVKKANKGKMPVRYILAKNYNSKKLTEMI